MKREIIKTITLQFTESEFDILKELSERVRRTKTNTLRVGVERWLSELNMEKAANESRNENQAGSSLVEGDA